MKIVKKCLILIMMIVIIGTQFFTNVNAYELMPIEKVGGGYVTYRNTNIQVQMPKTYIDDGFDFRAVWVSVFAGDIPSYTTEANFKADMNQLFEVMEYFNMNAMIFHIRTHNNALYKSKYNPLASWWANVNFDEFDPLEWLIEESHRRGIEFHAWMNPYRISSSNYVGSIPKSNPANNPEYVLNGGILDPGRPEVRDFLVKTVMEVISNYDVDAIHFDDYFYVRGVNDQATRDRYNIENLSIENFRRQQVDLFIQNLYSAMTKYNLENNRVVQLGISPSGIYKNGSYVPLENYQYFADGSLEAPTSSNTAGFAHYDDYLYSDTKNWIDNEWIDYIIPQAYWGHDHSLAQFADIMDWWNMVVANKKVNLYAGMGLYMAGADGGSWKNNPSEAANQVQYASKLEHVKGHSVYSYTSLISAYRNRSGIYYKNMSKVREKMWTKSAILPEIRTFSSITLPAVQNLQLSKTSMGYRIDFNEINNAKSYAIYRSESPLTYSSNELLTVVGKIGYDGVASYLDQVSTTKNYYYGVKAISKTNTVGAEASLNTALANSDGKLLPLGPISNIKINQIPYFNYPIDLQWNTIYPLFGGSVNYEVYKSHDGINYEKVTSSSNPLIVKNAYITQKVYLEDGYREVYLKIRAFNSISEDIKEMKIDVSKKIGDITNFTVIGDYFTNSQIEFKWNIISNKSNILYKLQQSNDGNNWVDITSTENPVVIKDNLAIQRYTLPSQPMTSYYRVFAYNNEGESITKSIKIDSYKNIGALVPTVNNQEYTGPVTVKTEQVVKITWNNFIYENYEANYIVMMSDDLKKWNFPITFNSSNYLDIGEKTTTQTINLDFYYHSIYIKIEAQTPTGRSYSEIIEIRRGSDNLELIVFMPYYLKTQTTYINKLNIFK